MTKRPPAQQYKTPRVLQVSETVMVEDCSVFLQKKTGKNAFPGDYAVVKYLMDKYGCRNSVAVAVLRGAKLAIAERVNALMPTLGPNVISELQETVQEAKRVGDLATAGRCLIALGRFAGLDQPQQSPEQQVRQLSDAALEAALEASIARKLESMPDDQLDDLMKRREAKRLAGAKQATLAPSPMVEAESTEAR